MKIRTKRQMYQMLSAGRFGCTMPTFLNLEHALDSGVTPLGVRSLRIGDPVRLYWVPREKLVGELKRCGAYGRQDLIYYSTDYGAEDSRRVQGELCRLPGGIYFYHTFVHQPMRVALEQDGRHAHGLRAEMLLREHVDEGPREWLYELLDTYPGCTVEFTSHRHPVGTLNQTIIIWEVRHY